MPRVPVYDNFQVAPNNLPNVRVDGGLSPEQAAAPGRQMQEFGRALQTAGGAGADIALDVQQQANQLRIDDALNKAAEIGASLTYDKEVGYQNLRGISALERPDGKPLADEYTGKLEQQLGGITDSLGNDYQKQQFSAKAKDMLTRFRAQTLAHEAQEFRTYAMSVREGTIANRINSIGLNYNNPEIIDEDVQSIEAAAFDMARMQGKSAAEAEAHARSMKSKAHLTALEAAMQKNDPAYADSYLKKYSKDMEANDILRANGVLTKQLDAKLAMDVADQIMQGAALKIDVPDADRAFNIAIQTESGGRQFDKDGKPLTSSAGAIGVAQVMPTTAPEAAKLAGVEWDEERYKNDPEYNRALGKAYFDKQLKDFGGSLAQAYAAYNAGPGATREALDKAKKEGGDWLAYLPKETQDYVQKNMTAFGTGGGKPARPTIAELHAQVREQVGTSSPDRLKLALDEVDRRYDEQTKAIKQRDEENTASAMQAVLQNGGRYADLPADIRASIPVENVGKVMDFAAKIGKGEDAATDWSTYYDLKNDPGLLANANLMALRNHLSDTEFKELVRDQADIKSGKADSMTRVRTIKDTLDQYLTEAGINPNPKPDDKQGAARVGRVWNQFEAIVREREAALGKKLGPDELSKEAARMFSSKVEVDDWFANSEYPAAAVGGDENIVIPEADKAQIIEALQSVGKLPTAQAVRDTYLRRKQRGG